MRVMILSLIILFLISGTVMAESAELVDTHSLVQGLPQESAEQLKDVSPSQSFNLMDTVINIWHKAVSRCTSTIREGVRLCFLILGIVMLCSLCINPRWHNELRLCIGVLGIFSAIAGSLHTMINLAQETIEKLRTYSGLLLPVMSSAMALSGAPTTAAVLHGITILFSQILMASMTKLLFPCVYFYLVLGAVEVSLQNRMMGEFRELLGWLIEKSLRILMYLFMGFLSISGIISGNADGLAVKATKKALSGMVPVIGSILSDASETMLVGANLIKNTAGAFGLVAVVSISLYPFLQIGVQYLLMKLTTACAGAVALPGHVSYLKHVSSAMGYVLAMTGICALLLLVCGICYLQVTVV